VEDIIVISFSVSEVANNKFIKMKLDKLQSPELTTFVLKRLGEMIVSDTVKNKLSGQVLNRVTGKLAQSQNYNVTENVLSVGSNLSYAAIHEYGGEITPDKGNFLRFEKGSKTIFARRVTIPPRPYLWPTIDEDFSNGRADAVGEQAFKDYVEV
jgi:phage gpG-like protein